MTECKEYDNCYNRDSEKCATCNRNTELEDNYGNITEYLDVIM